MINQAQVQSLAIKYQIDGFTIFREYLQLVFLSQLYSDNHSKHIYFKGGTAIRLLMGSPRFSEDLDFSTTLTKIQIKNIISILEEKLKQQLPTLEIKELYSGKGGIRYQIKYQSSDLKYPLNLRLDFTIVSEVIDPTVSPLVTDFPISIFPIISHLSYKEILTEKICALSSRTKGRDYYDTWYLLEKNVPLDQEMLQQKLAQNNLTLDIDVLNKKIKSYSQKNLSLDLAQFLPKSQKQILPILLNLLSKQLNQNLAI